MKAHQSGSVEYGPWKKYLKMKHSLSLRVSTKLFLLSNLFWFDLYSQPVNTTSQEPKLFLPEITSEIPHVRDLALSQDGLEAYFTVESYKRNISFIVRVEKDQAGWSGPQIAPFSGRYRDIEPHLSPDGKHLYFASNRPIEPAGETKDYDIWVVERQNSGETWGTPRNLGSPINSKGNEYYPSLSANGDLYFTAELPDSKGREDIYLSRFDGENYQPPESLSDSINSEFYEFNAFVDPDESFIIFTSYGRGDGQGGGDLYISRKTPSGEWKSAENMGPAVNSPGLDYCPFVDFDKGVLYFTSDRSLVKSSYAEPLNYKRFLEEVHQRQNGQSRIYEINFSKLPD